MVTAVLNFWVTLSGPCLLCRKGLWQPFGFPVSRRTRATLNSSSFSNQKLQTTALNRNKYPLLSPFRSYIQVLSLEPPQIVLSKSKHLSLHPSSLPSLLPPCFQEKAPSRLLCLPLLTGSLPPPQPRWHPTLLFPFLAHSRAGYRHLSLPQLFIRS